MTLVERRARGITAPLPRQLEHIIATAESDARLRFAAWLAQQLTAAARALYESEWARYRSVDCTNSREQRAGAVLHH